MASAYDITIDDIRAGLSEERLRDLTDDANTGAIDEATAHVVIGNVEREFHLRVAPYYATPLRTSAGVAPEGIKELLVRCTRWALASRRPEVMNTEHGEGKYWQSERDAVDREYAAMSNPDGSKRRPIAGALPVAAERAVAAGGARMTSDRRRFTVDNMRSWGQ